MVFIDIETKQIKGIGPVSYEKEHNLAPNEASLVHIHVPTTLSNATMYGVLQMKQYKWTHQYPQVKHFMECYEAFITNPFNQ